MMNVSLWEDQLPGLSPSQRRGVSMAAGAVFLVGMYLGLESLFYGPPKERWVPGTWHGQYGQDRWVAEGVFPGKRKGYFVEVGAYNGVTGSNTLALERDLGWGGLCIEADPRNYARLRRARRRCYPVYRAVDTEGGRIVRMTSDAHQSAVTGGVNASSGAPPAGSSAVPAATIREVLDANGAPEFIDFLSLDVEGMELKILQTFPFDRYRVGAWAVEVFDPTSWDGGVQGEIRELLESKGYVRVEEGGKSKCPPAAPQATRSKLRPPQYPKQQGVRDGGGWTPCVDDLYVHATLSGEYAGRRAAAGGSGGVPKR